MSDTTPKRKTALERGIEARLAWLRDGAPIRGGMSDRQRAVVCELIASGATIREVSELAGMPSETSIFAEARRNAQFAEDLKEARTRGATLVIDEAQLELREAIMSADNDRIARAHVYHKCAIEYAAKIAPQVFGSLAKLADDRDAARTSVQVVSYADDTKTSLPMGSD